MSTSPSKHSLLPYVLSILLFALAFNANANSNKAKEQELKKLRQTIEQLKRELKSAKSTRDDINNALEKTEKEIGQLNKKAKTIKTKLDQRQEKLDDLRDERGNLQDNKRSQEGIVADYVNAAYRLGQQGNLRLLLNQEDPARVARNLKYYDYLVSARAEKINEYMSTIQRINDIEPEIAYQRDLIANDYNELKRQQTQLASAQQKRQASVHKLNANIKNQDQKLRHVMEDRRQLERMLKKVIENISDIKFDRKDTFAKLKGKLPWPAKGKLLKRFGSQRVANKMRWEGLLIASNEGSPVKAVHYGRVIFADYLRGQGLLIIVDHGAGFMSLYAHNQALYKTLGEWVESGETIASVGNSGGQQKSALYFELRYKGKPKNPKHWLKRA